MRSRPSRDRGRSGGSKLQGARRRLSTLLLAGAMGLTGCTEDPGLDIGEERITPDEPAIRQELIRLTKQITRERAGDDGVLRRFNQPKSIGCLDGTFVVGELPERLAVGLFAEPARYPVSMRFANATQYDDREADLRGLSLQVSGISGAATFLGKPGVQDFLLNSHPALFAGTPRDFLSFVQATAKGRAWWYFLNPADLHLRSLLIVLKARDHPVSPTAVRYFSTTPYRYGSVPSTVKYAVQACGTGANATPTGQDGDVPDDPDYLRAALKRDVADGGLCLELAVQFQTDPIKLPMEDASVTWPEEISPFHKVAEVTVAPQDFTAPAAMARCEAMQFAPWNSVQAHQPLGGINRVRRNLYTELGEFRTGDGATDLETRDEP